MNLQEVWFGLIAVLFLGFFILEGFDFGVGMLMEPFARVGKGDREAHRRAALNTIGPVWDGNEVWLITAGAAMFAAFPGWYATVFSTLYLPLLAILFGMIVRVVSIEWRGKVDDPRWRGWADFAIAAGSWLPAVLWGMAFAVLVRGLPVDADGQVAVVDRRCAQSLYAAGRFGHRRAVLVLRRGVRRVEDRRARIRDDAQRFAVWLALPATGLVAGFGVWTQLAYGKDWTWAAAGRRGGRAVGRGAAGVAARVRRLGIRMHACWWWQPWWSCCSASLYPNLVPSTLNSAMECDDLQRLVDPLHTQDHDVGDCDHGSADGRLPGMDVLGFPATDLG